MNSQECRVSDAALRRISPLVLVTLFALGSALLCGCARIKQYSVDSWQGPLPVSDQALVQVDPDVR